MQNTLTKHSPKKPSQKSGSAIIGAAIEHFKDVQDCIFRGECENYNKQGKSRALSSGLYRQILDIKNKSSADDAADAGASAANERGKSEKNPEMGIDSLTLDEEESIVNKAKPYFPGGTKNIDILAEIQHYRGKTALLDFSKNILTALFFACYGRFDRNGYLYGFSRDDFDQQDDIDYAKIDEDSGKVGILIEPPVRNPRVIFQSSVFVRPHHGFLKLKRQRFTIPAENKADVLAFLEAQFAINEQTIYNDIHGYIENMNNSLNSKVEYFNGYALKDKTPRNAIGYFTRALKINPRMWEAYYYCAEAREKIGKYAPALGDYNKAKEIKSDIKGIDERIAAIEARLRE